MIPEIRFKPMDVAFDCTARRPHRLVLGVDPKYYPNYCYQVAGRDWNGSLGVYCLRTKEEWLKWIEKFAEDFTGRELRECKEAVLNPFVEPPSWAEYRKRFAETGKPWIDDGPHGGAL